jgi:translation initiation factor 2B subunit (eIF-2B alpha/beta/delta family)
MAREAVVCVLRHGTEVLFARRASRAESASTDDESVSVDGAGGSIEPFDAISAPSEGRPVETARNAVADVLAPSVTHELRRRGDPIPPGNPDSNSTDPDDASGPRRSGRLHPFLFECESRRLGSTPDTEYGWWQPPELIDRPTAPRLWDAYRAVAPTVSTVRTDAEHGSAYVSVRALEVLRDRAADRVIDDGDRRADLESIAESLLDARPAMAVVRTRINRVMATADGTPASVLEAATDACRQAVEADERAAERAAAVVGDRVFTLSRSGTVLRALELSAPEAVFVAESRPGGEGVAVAESLSAAGIDATVLLDAAVGALLASGAVDTVLVGADSVRPDGRVVNKVGTRHAAWAADAVGVPCFVVCSRDKIAPAATDSDTEAAVETAPEAGGGNGDDDGVSEYAPTFERVPAALVSGIVTESGVLSTSDIERVAAEHAAAAAWNGR